MIACVDGDSWSKLSLELRDRNQSWAGNPELSPQTTKVFVDTTNIFVVVSERGQPTVAETDPL